MSAAAFPPPPPYYKLYADFSDDPSSAPSPPPPVVGTYVQYGGNYTTTDVLPGLEEEGLRQLYPSGSDIGYLLNVQVLLQMNDKLFGMEHFLEVLRSSSRNWTLERLDYKRELRALNRELVLQFLELTDALIERPSQSARCVEDMTLLLRNIHHLLNSLRPHQARATVIHLLETQLVRRREALAEIRRKRSEARAMLQEYSATL